MVVVDNGDCFETPNHRITQWARVERIRPGCNFQWLNSCNLGASLMLAYGLPYVCFMNDDASLSENFFAGLIQTFQQQPQAAAVVPQYNGFFLDPAISKVTSNWQPEDTEEEVEYVEGTCLMLSRYAIETVGLLDPLFRPPGWGADVDYSCRITKAGLKMFVSHRSMFWHTHVEGGTSARVVYGSYRRYVEVGEKQLKENFQTKYGPNWREVIPVPSNKLPK